MYCASMFRSIFTSALNTDVAKGRPLQQKILQISSNMIPTSNKHLYSNSKQINGKFDDDQYKKTGILISAALLYYNHMASLT